MAPRPPPLPEDFWAAAVGGEGREIDRGGAVAGKISVLQSAISHACACQRSLMQLWVMRRKTETWKWKLSWVGRGKGCHG